MKQITTSKGTFIFVQVPDTFQPTATSTFEIMHNLYLREVVHIKTDLEFICTTNQATDESADMFGICAITKDGTMYKYGVVANDGLPAAQGEKGWCWSDFEPTLQSAINKFIKQNKLSRNNNYAIIQKL